MICESSCPVIWGKNVMSEERRSWTSQGYAWILFGLTGLFVLRVIGQGIQAWHPVAFLPSFEHWHSGAFPYPLLLTFQLVIVGWCLWVVWSLMRGLMVPSRKVGKTLLWLGGFYGMVMLIRLVVGLTIAPDHVWFGARLPTVFHFVLATFLWVYGRCHLSQYSPNTSIPKKELG